MIMARTEVNVSESNQTVIVDDSDEDGLDSDFFKPDIIRYSTADTNIIKEEDSESSSQSYTFGMGLCLGIGYPHTIENETLRKLASFGTFRGGFLMSLLYTPNNFFGAGVESGLLYMNCGIGVGNVDGRIEFMDIPIRLLFRFGFKVFYLEPYGGIIWQKLKIYGTNIESGKDAVAIALDNPFNAEAGCKIMFGGTGKFFIELGYVYSILWQYPRIGIGCNFEFSG